MSTLSQQELILKEEQLIKVSVRVVYGCIVAIVCAAVWLTTISMGHAALKVDYEDHKKSGAEYRTLNDRRWLRQNNALIRLQERAGIKVPREELEDPLESAD